MSILVLNIVDIEVDVDPIIWFIASPTALIYNSFNASGGLEPSLPIIRSAIMRASRSRIANKFVPTIPCV